MFLPVHRWFGLKPCTVFWLHVVHGITAMLPLWKAAVAAPPRSAYPHNQRAKTHDLMGALPWICPTTPNIQDDQLIWSARRTARKNPGLLCGLGGAFWVNFIFPGANRIHDRRSHQARLGASDEFN